MMIPHPINHVYIHIPFCHRRCSYCDFNTYANMEHRMDAYVEALCGELALLRDAHRQRLGYAPPTDPGYPSFTRAALKPTIFLGGGTPSMLPLPLMKRVLAAADKIVSLDSAEVTVEANPGTVLGGDYLRGLRDLGVNRLSMGVQSLHDPTLKVLGRIHTAAEARTSFEDARRAGFSNVNIDFIFGLPDQSEESWRESLGQIADWGADHLSLYSLIVEQGTPLESQVAAGRVQVPDDDTTGAMYEAAMVQLDAAGYQQYEISNWARRQDSPFPITNSRPPHFACHHNLAYWLNADYLAAGAGAHGHVFPTRYSDIRGINEYIRAVRAGNLPLDERTDLDQGDLEAETMFMGLRLNAGVSFAHFEDRCGRTLDAAFGETVAELIGLGLLERDTAAVRLTERGRMLGNQVFARFV